MSWIDDAIETFVENEDRVANEVIREFLSGEYLRQPWKLVDPREIERVWSEPHRIGFVRSVKALERIASLVLENIHRLSVNTIIMGHTPWHPNDMFDHLGICLSEEERDAFSNFCIDENDTWRISDYAMDKLKTLAVKIYAEDDPEQKLVLLDRVLNIIHARSDLSSWFVKGGVGMLDWVSSYKEAA